MPPPNCLGLIDGMRSPRIAAATAAVTAAALVAEQAGQAAIEVAPEFFEIGRALIAATALAATRARLPQPWSLRDMRIPADHVYLVWVVEEGLKQ